MTTTQAIKIHEARSIDDVVTLRSKTRWELGGEIVQFQASGATIALWGIGHTFDHRVREVGKITGVPLVLNPFLANGLVAAVLTTDVTELATSTFYTGSLGEKVAALIGMGYRSDVDATGFGTHWSVVRGDHAVNNVQHARAWEGAIKDVKSERLYSVAKLIEPVEIP